MRGLRTNLICRSIVYLQEEVTVTSHIVFIKLNCIMENQCRLVNINFRRCLVSEKVKRKKRKEGNAKNARTGANI